MKEIIRGFFEYKEKDEGWNDSFTIADDDGMPFALQHLKKFEGKDVQITIETEPKAEARAEWFIYDDNGKAVDIEPNTPLTAGLHNEAVEAYDWLLGLQVCFAELMPPYKQKQLEEFLGKFENTLRQNIATILSQAPKKES